jgi:hypothetical protein
MKNGKSSRCTNRRFRMNIPKKMAMAGLLFFCYLFCHAQRIQSMDSVHKLELKEFQYIFEGTITHQESYKEKNNNNALTTCSVMQITKIFKGNKGIKPGNIKIITFQGNEIDNTGPALNNNGRYIIFGGPADSVQVNRNMVKTDNTIILQCYDYILFSDKIQWRNSSTQYRTPDELYAFFKENGLTVSGERK